MLLAGVLILLICIMIGYFIGRAETMETGVVYIKERLYRLIKNKCYKSLTGESIYCGNRYIISLNGDLYVQTKGGYKKCMPQK